MIKNEKGKIASDDNGFLYDCILYFSDWVCRSNGAGGQAERMGAGRDCFGGAGRHCARASPKELSNEYYKKPICFNGDEGIRVIGR